MHSRHRDGDTDVCRDEDEQRVGHGSDQDRAHDQKQCHKHHGPPAHLVCQQAQYGHVHKAAYGVVHVQRQHVLLIVTHKVPLGNNGVCPSRNVVVPLVAGYLLASAVEDHNVDVIHSTLAVAFDPSSALRLVKQGYTHVDPLVAR